MQSRSLFASVLIIQICAVGPASAVSPSCAVPVEPGRFAARASQIVTGFVGQRLYLHAKHPDACAGASEDACQATAYVVSGDKVQIGDVCGAWTAAKFAGKHGDYYGWVESDRLAEVSAVPTASTVTDLNALTAAPPVCSRLRDYYQGVWLEGRTLPAPFEIVQPHSVDVPPKGFVPTHNFGSTPPPDIFEVTLNGNPAKLVNVSDTGMCVPQYTEVWSADLHRYLGTPAGARRGQLALIDGKTYMLSGGSDRMEIIGFHSDLSSFPVCAITPRPFRPEQVVFAANAGLCNAVRSGKVEDVGLDEITPIPVDADSFGSITDEVEGALRFEFSRRGLVDIDNSGRKQVVAMARADGPPLGCGTKDYVWEWPQADTRPQS
jgi:hypothetical protein